MAELEIVVPAIITIENKADRAIGFVPYRENFRSIKAKFW